MKNKYWKMSVSIEKTFQVNLLLVKYQENTYFIIKTNNKQRYIAEEKIGILDLGRIYIFCFYPDMKLDKIMAKTIMQLFWNCCF